MEVATFDWNLLITALAGLGGVAVGGFVTWKIQDRQLKHVDENRFQEQRMDAYVLFTTSSNLVLTHKGTGDRKEMEKHTLDMVASLQKIHVISTKEVRQTATAVLNVTGKYNHEEGSESGPGEDFKNAVSNFWQAVRKELKIDINI